MLPLHIGEPRLRLLVHADDPLQLPALPPAAHDAYIVHENKVQHWNSVTRRVTTVMDVSGGITGAVAPGIGQVQLCTLCAR